MEAFGAELLDQLELLVELVLFLHELGDQGSLLGLRAGLLPVVLALPLVHIVHDATDRPHRRILLLLLGIDAVNAIRERIDESLKRLEAGRISQRVKP